MTHQIEIKVYFRAGHRLMEPYEGKCNNPHGEGYTAILIFESDTLDSNGMVLDFGKVKKVVYSITNEFYDHSFMFNRDDKKGNLATIFRIENFKTYLMNGNPTAENISKDLYNKIKILYPSLKKVGIIESFDDSIAWYEETIKQKEIVKEPTWDKFKFGDELKNQLVKIFGNNDLDFGIGFNNTKICANCTKPITGFSEWCTFHYKKRRDFCSQNCFNIFVQNYIDQKEKEEMMKQNKKELSTRRERRFTIPK